MPFFFSTDELAAAAIFECQRRGLSVPQDLAIMGFNDLEIASEVVPTITSVTTPRREIGIKSAQILLELIANPKMHKPQIDMGFKIVEREST